MEYDEIVERYNNMTIKEFGEACKNHFKSEENIFENITKVEPELIGAALFGMIENYSAMRLPFRWTNFIMRLYIEAVKKGIEPSWQSDYYKNNVEDYLKKISFSSLENGLELLVEKFAKQYKKDTIFKIDDGESLFSENIQKARSSFANYGDDEKPIFYNKESVFGFTNGFVGTDKRIYFTDNGSYSVKYENILDFYFEYCETDTTTRVAFFNTDKLEILFSQLPECTNAENVYIYLRILYCDENTGKLCDRRLSQRVIWQTHDNVFFALIFINTIKDYIIVKNYEHYIEARKRIEPGFAEIYNKNEQDAISNLNKMYREMSSQKIGLKCRELINDEIEAVKSIGRLNSDDINARITELTNHYMTLGLDYRLNSFMLNVLIEADKKGITLDVVSQFKPKLTDYFVEIPKTISAAIDDLVKNMGLKAFIEKMDNKKGQIKKIEKAKKVFATIAPDEQVLLFCCECMFGFSKGFIITDKKMHFCIDKIFSVSYENVVDFFIKLNCNVEINTFRIEDLERYVRNNPDTFRKYNCYMKILYTDETTGALCEERFQSFSINDLETAKYMFTLAEKIKNHAFALKYLKYFR